MQGHEHLPKTERDRFFNSNSIMYAKAQKDDYTFMPSSVSRIHLMKPLGRRVLVELILEEDEHNTGIIRPLSVVKTMKSRVVAVGTEANSKIKVGMEVLHQHRCGVQIGFYGEKKLYRIIPDRLIMGIYGCP